ncbi:MAG: TolC family protein, partial [Deltaproteobacteria bacterium]|nr:TolC family protein [Deltaproteobacteria bacterium]
RIDQARFGQEQAEKQKKWVEQRVRLEVIRAYYGVRVAEANERVAEEAVTMAEAYVKRVRDRYETGVVVQADLLAAEVQLAEFRQQRVQTEGDRVSAYAFLNTVLGLTVDTPQKMTGQLTDRVFAPEPPEELIRLALLHRPDYLKAGLAVRTTEKQIEGTQGRYLPRLDVFSSYGLSGKDLTSGSSDYAVGAGLTFNLFDPGRKPKIEQARAAQSQASAEQAHLANQIRLEVTRAYQQFIGLTIITEVLRAQTAVLRTRMNLLAARYENYVGYANLIMISGRLTDVLPFT